jgi:hypothetical protein
MSMTTEQLTYNIYAMPVCVAYVCFIIINNIVDICMLGVYARV